MQQISTQFFILLAFASIPLLLYFFFLVNFYILERIRINNKLTSDNLKKFKEKFIEIKVPLARKNLEAQSITGHKRITGDVLQYLMEKNVTNLNFTLYAFSYAIDYVYFKNKSLDIRGKEQLHLYISPIKNIDRLKKGNFFIFILFLTYLCSIKYIVDIVIAYDLQFTLKYTGFSIGILCLSIIAIFCHKNRCLFQVDFYSKKWN